MQNDDFWNPDAILKDLLLSSNLSIKEIATELGMKEAPVYKRIKTLGLDWIRKENAKLSKGHAALTNLMQSLLPGEKIVNEHPIGERLRLDIYCDSYKLAAEYHGRQHFFYTNMFHKSIYDFKDSQKRDERKIELCEEQGIALVVFKYDDNLTQEIVFDRMVAALRTTPVVEEVKKPKLSGNPYYDKMKQRSKDYRREQYRRMKNRKNDS